MFKLSCPAASARSPIVAALAQCRVFWFLHHCTWPSVRYNPLAMLSPRQCPQENAPVLQQLGLLRRLDQQAAHPLQPLRLAR